MCFRSFFQSFRSVLSVASLHSAFVKAPSRSLKKTARAYIPTCVCEGSVFFRPLRPERSPFHAFLTSFVHWIVRSSVAFVRPFLLSFVRSFVRSPD